MCIRDRISSSPDPQAFPPFEFAGMSGRYFGELSFDVPVKVREEQYDIVRVDIFAAIRADTLVTSGSFVLEVDLYLGLESGDRYFDDPARVEYLTTVAIVAQGEVHHVRVRDPRLIEAALQREAFYLKGVLRLSSTAPTAGRVTIDGVYFDAYLERDTSGLVPLLYFF